MTASEPNSSSTSAPSLIGTRLGDFQIMRKLGRGGMADVYAARQISLNRDVALKVLRPEFARDKDYIQRFRREARAAARLNHPNIVQVFEVGNIDSQYYIAQELIDGENLRQRLDRDGVIDSELAVEVLIGVAAALKVAMEAGITHRDIKPENIMQSASGIIKVADFGLARFNAEVDVTGGDLTQAGLTMGTPRYMSPEQVQGKRVDVRSDLYSLGVTMYHLLAGRPPFEADEPLALALMHLQETPAPIDRVRSKLNASGNPDLDEWLIAVVNRLMSKSIEARFQSPDELISAIRNESPMVRLENLGAGTAAATIRLQRATDQVRKQREKRSLRWLAAVGLPLLCLSIAAWLAVNYQGKTIDDILRPETVPRADTVQVQYLNAVIRGDEMGWRSVGQHFPPAESATNAAYYAKAQLQLSRLLAESDRLDEADRILKRLQGDPGVDRIYQAIALSQRFTILNQLGRESEIASVRQQFQSLYSELEATNPNLLRQLEQVVTTRELLLLGVGNR